MKWGSGEGLSTWYCDMNASGIALGMEADGASLNPHHMLVKSK